MTYSAPIYPDDDPEPPAREPRGHARYSDEVWQAAREYYAYGCSAPQICDFLGMPIGTFRDRAAREGWRRADAPGPGPVQIALTDPLDVSGPPSPASTLADQAWRRAGDCVRRGRLSDAQGWAKLSQTLRAQAAADVHGEEVRAREQRAAEERRLREAELRDRAEERALALAAARTPVELVQFDPGELAERFEELGRQRQAIGKAILAIDEALNGKRRRPRAASTHTDDPDDSDDSDSGDPDDSNSFDDDLRSCDPDDSDDSDSLAQESESWVTAPPAPPPDAPASDPAR